MHQVITHFHLVYTITITTMLSIIIIRYNHHLTKSSPNWIPVQCTGIPSAQPFKYYCNIQLGTAFQHSPLNITVISHPSHQTTTVCAVKSKIIIIMIIKLYIPSHYNYIILTLISLHGSSPQPWRGLWMYSRHVLKLVPSSVWFSPSSSAAVSNNLNGDTGRKCIHRGGLV